MSIIFPAIDDHFLDYISVYVYTSRYFWAFNSIMNVNRFYSLIIAVIIKRVVNFETCIHQEIFVFSNNIRVLRFSNFTYMFLGCRSL